MSVKKYFISVTNSRDKTKLLSNDELPLLYYAKCLECCEANKCITWSPYMESVVFAFKSKNVIQYANNIWQMYL